MNRREGGFALVAVLVVLTAAAALAAAALTLSRSGVGGAIGYATEMEGGHAASAALRLTAIRLADAEGHTIGDLSPGAVDWMGWRVAIRIEDEAGKIDLNRVPRTAVARALTDLGLPRRSVDDALADEARRFVSVDEVGGALGLRGQALAALRARFTVYGGDVPQPRGLRSPLETYRIVASAARDGRRITRWAVFRLSPGFGEPFEWLERGEGGDFEPS